MVDYIDTHSHLNFPQYDEDREKVINRMREAGVVTILIGTGYKSSKEAVTMAELQSDVVMGATVGLHPADAIEGFEIAKYEQLLNVGTSDVPTFVVGVGECGLDYFRTHREDVYKKQVEVFEMQIEFAVKYDLPLVLHIRPSKGEKDAHYDALSILKSFQGKYGNKVRGTSHFFTSTLDIAKEYWKIGFMTSFSGVITFDRELSEVVSNAPIDMILSETDSPYASPVPHRGKRNEPTYVTEVVKTISEIRGSDFNKTCEQLLKNGNNLFFSDTI